MKIGKFWLNFVTKIFFDMQNIGLQRSSRYLFNLIKDEKNLKSVKKSQIWKINVKKRKNTLISNFFSFLFCIS